MTEEPSGANKSDVQFGTEQILKVPVNKPEFDNETKRVSVSAECGMTVVCETVTFNEGVSVLVAFKFILEIETSIDESVFSRMAGTKPLVLTKLSLRHSKSG